MICKPRDLTHMWLPAQRAEKKPGKIQMQIKYSLRKWRDEVLGGAFRGCIPHPLPAKGQLGVKGVERK